MKLNKLTLVGLILAATTTAWTIREGGLRQTRRAIADARVQASAAEERARLAEDELVAVQTRLAEARRRHDVTQAEVAAATRELAKRDPESAWTEPPESLPQWSAESPFVWLRKEIVPKLPVEAFQSTGELRPEVAYVLTLDSTQQEALNTALRRCLNDYRKIETAHVERLEEHLPGIAGQDGERLTIRVTPVPEAGTNARREFEAALRNALGDQRTDLLLEVSEDWLSSEFSGATTETKTISVLRRPGGSLDISIKSGNSWLSTGVPKDRPEMINHYIPPHLQPFFREFLEPAVETGAPIEPL